MVEYLIHAGDSGLIRVDLEDDEIVPAMISLPMERGEDLFFEDVFFASRPRNRGIVSTPGPAAKWSERRRHLLGE